jgi:hypothetical protein
MDAPAAVASSFADLGACVADGLRCLQAVLYTLDHAFFAGVAGFAVAAAVRVFDALASAVFWCLGPFSFLARLPRFFYDFATLFVGGLRNLAWALFAQVYWATPLRYMDLHLCYAALVATPIAAALWLVALRYRGRAVADAFAAFVAGPALLALWVPTQWWRLLPYGACCALLGWAPTIVRHHWGGRLSQVIAAMRAEPVFCAVATAYSTCVCVIIIGIWSVILGVYL